VLTEMAQLSEAGCVGFSQADRPVQDTMVMLRAMQYAATFGHTVWLRPQDSWLGKGVAASGAVATRLGLSSVPVAAETVALHTIIELVRTTGARVHLCRLSSAAGVALVRAAKAEQLPITADVSVHSLHLTDVDIGYFNAECGCRRVAAGRRSRCLRSALADGTIDALVSDHNPVEDDAKNLPFAEAEPGASAVELLLCLALKWGQEMGLDLPDTLARVTSDPVRVLGAGLGPLSASAGRLIEGGVADICVFDPNVTWQVTRETLTSQGKHTPFDFAASGTALPGRVRATVLAGGVSFEDSHHDRAARGLRQVCRAFAGRVVALLRVAHVLHGTAVVALRFGSLDAVQRRQRASAGGREAC
jgi:dihydroorotase